MSVRRKIADLVSTAIRRAAPQGCAADYFWVRRCIDQFARSRATEILKAPQLHESELRAHATSR